MVETKSMTIWDIFPKVVTEYDTYREKSVWYYSVRDMDHWCVEARKEWNKLTQQNKDFRDTITNMLSFLDQEAEDCNYVQEHGRLLRQMRTLLSEK